jgi:hypothetical protein
MSICICTRSPHFIIFDLINITILAEGPGYVITTVLLSRYRSHFQIFLTIVFLSVSALTSVYTHIK